MQATFATHLKDKLGRETVYAWNDETFGPVGTLGRKDTTEAVLTLDLRTALQRLNPDLPHSAIDEAMRALTVHDFSRSMVQHNQDFGWANLSSPFGKALLTGDLALREPDSFSRTK